MLFECPRRILLGLVSFAAAATVLCMTSAALQTACAKGTTTPSTAATASSSKTFNDAVSLYNAKKYTEALAKLDAVLKDDSKHTAAHYYRALSLHYLGKSSAAKTEYDWVIKNATNADMKNRAQTGLNSLLGIAAARPKVYDFYTNWCVPCKVMAPIFEELKTTYKGKIDMQSLDAEDPANKTLVDKYSVSGYPTFIFVDGSGKQVDIVLGSLNKNQFEERLQRLISR